jgi:hypothetical protein
MPGLVPGERPQPRGIHVLKPSKIKNVDGRVKPGHDVLGVSNSTRTALARLIVQAKIKTRRLKLILSGD